MPKTDVNAHRRGFQQGKLCHFELLLLLLLLLLAQIPASTIAAPLSTSGPKSAARKFRPRDRARAAPGRAEPSRAGPRPRAAAARRARRRGARDSAARGARSRSRTCRQADPSPSPSPSPRTLREAGMRVRELQRRLAAAAPLAGRKRACVALLLRVAPEVRRARPDLEALLDQVTGGDLAQPAREARAQEVFDSVDVRDLEAFFILRASNDDDRWGGQVGLPGGRQNPGESDRATAAREVFEEVGLVLPDLDPSISQNSADRPSPFAFVGRVHDRKVLQGKDALIVCSFVYMQVTNEELTLTPEPSEVGACGWSPMAALLENDVAKPLSYSIGNMGFPKENPAAFKLMQMLKLDRMYFSMVPLRVDPLYISSEVDPRDGHARASRPGETPPETEQAVRQAFFLWGMTLGIVNDLLTDISGLRTERIGVTDKILPGFRVEKLFGSKAHNLLLHSLRNGYQLAFSEPMPWSMYMRTYPMLVLALSSATPLIVGTSLWSRM